MRPRVSVSRLKFKRLSPSWKNTRVRQKTKPRGTDEYFIRSWVLDELNKALKPISKDVYSLRKTLYEEKREMVNRVGLLEDDLRNVTSIVTSYRLDQNSKRWMSRSSIDPSSSSSLDNINTNEIFDIRSPTMIDVQKLEFQLQRQSVDDLTQKSESKQSFNGNDSLTPTKGVKNQRKIMNRSNKRSWQSSQSMDTGLDLIPSEQDVFPLTYLKKRIFRSNAGMAPSYSGELQSKEGPSCRKVLIGSNQSIIGEESKENENPTDMIENRRPVMVGIDKPFARKSATLSGIPETPKRTIKPLNDNNNSIDVGEFFSKGHFYANSGKIVGGNIPDAEREKKEDLYKRVQLVDGSHRKFSDTYSEICAFIQQREDKRKSLSLVDLSKINNGRELFVGLLEKSQSGVVSEADVTLAQDLVDDIEVIDAKLKALASINPIKTKKSSKSEIFKNQTEKEIGEDVENSTAPVKRRICVLEEKMRELKEKQINDHENVLDRESANATKKNPVDARRIEKNGGVDNDLRKLLDQKKSNSQLNVKNNEGHKDLRTRNNKNNKKPPSNSQPKKNQRLLDKNSKLPAQAKEDALQFKQCSALPQKTASNERVEDYESLLKNFEKVLKDIAVFSADESLKKIRVDCQKTINVTLNTITAQCASHLLDKYEKLSSFLNNGTVIISEKPITASIHPLGALYSLNYLAMKTVNQGERCVSYNFEAAYSIASIVVALWTDMPQYGKLLLSHFYRAAPYLIPAYWERKCSESDEQYYRRLDLFFPKNEKEDIDQFLKKQSGIIRLYFAIVVTSHKTSNKSKPHPFPLTVAWKWLAAFLALPPKPDISATLLLDMLEVTAHMMAATYNAQFWKILNAINILYLPLIKKVTPDGRGGPPSRLRAFLEGALKDRTVPPPKGLLPPNFW